MLQKPELKKQAVALRKQGKTYNEILEVVPVAKSTLSLWLRDVGLAKAQKEKLTAKNMLLKNEAGLQEKSKEFFSLKKYMQEQC